MALLVYAIPFLASIASGALLFAFPLAVSEATGDSFLSGMVVLVSGFTYVLMTAALMLGKPQERISLRLVYAGLIGLVLAGALPAIWMGAWWSVYAYTAFQGFGSAAFLVCFQIVLQVVASRYTIAVSFSAFIMSWALGYAVGPFVSGFFHDATPAVPLLFAAGCAAVAIILLIVVRRLNLRTTPRLDPEPLPVSPAAVRFGWGLIFLSGFFLVTVRGLFPDFALKAGFSSSGSGSMLFVMFMALTATALAMRFWYRNFVARPISFLLVIAGYIGGTLLLALAPTIATAYVAMILLGISIAIGYFFAGSFALSDAANKARNVGVNETVVGIASIIGPLGGALIADNLGYQQFFLASAVLAVLVFGVAFAGQLRSSR